MIDVTNLVKIEYHGEPVLTTKQLASLYGCTTRHVRQNFSHRKEEFTKGVHYFYLEGAALKKFKEDYGAFSGVDSIYIPFTPLASSLYLWTHRGFARHCKLIDTPQAWDMFTRLEDTYFAVLENEPPPLPPLEPPKLTDGKKLLIEILESINDVNLQRLFVREIVSMLIK